MVVGLHATEVFVDLFSVRLFRRKGELLHVL